MAGGCKRLLQETHPAHPVLATPLFLNGIMHTRLAGLLGDVPGDAFERRGIEDSRARAIRAVNFIFVLAIRGLCCVRQKKD